jgi:hypothetical protein
MVEFMLVESSASDNSHDGVLAIDDNQMTEADRSE